MYPSNMMMDVLLYSFFPGLTVLYKWGCLSLHLTLGWVGGGRGETQIPMSYCIYLCVMIVVLPIQVQTIFTLYNLKEKIEI